MSSSSHHEVIELLDGLIRPFCDKLTPAPPCWKWSSAQVPWVSPPLPQWCWVSVWLVGWFFDVFISIFSNFTGSFGLKCSCLWIWAHGRGLLLLYDEVKGAPPLSWANFLLLHPRGSLYLFLPILTTFMLGDGGTPLRSIWSTTCCPMSFVWIPAC